MSRELQLKVAYEHIRGVLDGQLQDADSNNNRAYAFIAIATAIVSITIPLILDKVQSHLCLVLTGAIVIFFLYALILVFSYQFSKRVNVITLDNPKVIIHDFIGLEPEAF